MEPKRPMDMPCPEAHRSQSLVRGCKATLHQCVRGIGRRHFLRYVQGLFVGAQGLLDISCLPAHVAQSSVPN